MPQQALMYLPFAIGNAMSAKYFDGWVILSVMICLIVTHTEISQMPVAAEPHSLLNFGVQMPVKLTKLQSVSVVYNFNFVNLDW